MALDSMEKKVIHYLLDLVEVDLVDGAAKHSGDQSRPAELGQQPGKP